MMTLDEAIEHSLEKTKGCDKCAEEHKQLTGWLTELKCRRQEDSERHAHPNMHVYLYHDGNDGAPITDIWTHSVPGVGEKVIVWNEEQFVKYTVAQRIWGCNIAAKVGVWNLYLKEEKT